MPNLVEEMTLNRTEWKKKICVADPNWYKGFVVVAL